VRNDTLKVSEHFYSIQGEGMSSGRQSVFWRFQGCVLNCGFCDTTEVWKKGTTYTFAEWHSICRVADYYVKMKNGHGASLILTGGDPMIQQEAITAYFDYLQAQGGPNYPTAWNIEVETQATLPPTAAFAKYVKQWNLSPKLSNSGEPESKRLKYAVLASYLGNHYIPYQLKFVVANESDAKEAMEIVKRLSISSRNVFFMPMASNRKQMAERAPLVAKIAMDSGVNYSPRLQVDIWDQVTGV